MHKLSAIIAGLFFLNSTSPAISNNNTFAVADSKLTIESARVATFELNMSDTYSGAHLKDAGLDYEVFRKAMIGYYNLKRNNVPMKVSKPVLSIIDFNKASTEERLWIIDLKSKKLLYNTLVAHGKNSGDNFARKFSNVPQSEMSSVGFYVTGETYHGKHGLSLRINGIDRGFNDKARDRAIVIHGASYVSESFVNRHGRLGRSQGCPALPVNKTTEIVQLIKDRSCIFINGPEPRYNSNFLNLEPAVAKFEKEINNAQNQI